MGARKEGEREDLAESGSHLKVSSVAAVSISIGSLIHEKGRLNEKAALRFFILRIVMQLMLACNNLCWRE